jgi:class 3 adenylate cyclase
MGETRNDVQSSTLEFGRDAVSRRAWGEGANALAAADREQALSPEDLELLGTAAWWAARLEDSTDALERAVAGFEEAGRPEDAARVATWLAYQAFRRVAPAIGQGWITRAQRLLQQLPDSPWQAFIRVMQGKAAMSAGRIDEAIADLDEASAIARRGGSPDALYVAMAMRGLAEVMSGKAEAGLAELDEAAAAASSGNLDLRSASDIFCIMIGACRDMGDLQRAAEWADESERWMVRNGAGGYPGICRVHRAELKMLRGNWSAAEQEARTACDELQRFHLLDGVGLAWNAIGEVRLRMGDLDRAQEAFDRAYEFGHDGQPGLSLLHLARGHLEEARRSISGVLATSAGAGGLSDRAARARLLPAQVDIALAAGDLDTAGRAVAELEEIASDYDQPLFRAGALTARGEFLLGEHRPAEASPILGQSWRLWQTADLPYEAARARLHYAEALVAAGDASEARRDLLAVRATFERLGATLDLRAVDGLLGGESPGPSAPAAEVRSTRTFMFTDIVTSTDLVGVIGDEAWTELLEWHDRELRAAFAHYHGEVVNHTGDGFFAAFERPTDAIDCAIDIQRRLFHHRREHGFAPWIRIGLHTTEATRRGRDYSGRGVHIAARVGAAAEREEILATSAALMEVPPARFAVYAPRQLSLKGIAEPVEVVSVNWH